MKIKKFFSLIACWPIAGFSLGSNQDQNHHNSTRLEKRLITAELKRLLEEGVFIERLLLDEFHIYENNIFIDFSCFDCFVDELDMDEELMAAYNEWTISR